MVGAGARGGVELLLREVRTAEPLARAVAERLGLRLDGVLPAAMTLRGRREDVALHGLPAPPWSPPSDG